MMDSKRIARELLEELRAGLGADIDGIDGRYKAILRELTKGRHAPEDIDSKQSELDQFLTDGYMACAKNLLGRFRENGRANPQAVEAFRRRVAQAGSTIIKAGTTEEELASFIEASA